MFSIEARKQRLTENCLRFWECSAEQQYVIINWIISDSQILRVKMSDYLASPSPIRANVVQINTHCCPYCERSFGNGTGLKAHLGRQHADKKAEWSVKI